jgi:uncharacterized protein YceK
MNLRPALLLAGVLPLAVASTGCGIIWSHQTYGSPGLQRVNVNNSKAEVFANMGQPATVYRDDTGEVLVYPFVEGRNVLGLYGQIRRTDTVVVMDATGRVVAVQDIRMGDGWAIPAFPGLDLTHPARTSTLLEGADNYEYNYNQGE